MELPGKGDYLNETGICTLTGDKCKSGLCQACVTAMNDYVDGIIRDDDVTPTSKRERYGDVLYVHVNPTVTVFRFDGQFTEQLGELKKVDWWYEHLEECDIEAVGDPREYPFAVALMKICGKPMKVYSNICLPAVLQYEGCFYVVAPRMSADVNVKEMYE